METRHSRLSSAKRALHQLRRLMKPNCSPLSLPIQPDHCLRPSLWIRANSGSDHRVWHHQSGIRLEQQVPVKDVGLGTTVHQLAAKKLLQELDEGGRYLHSGEFGVDPQSEPGKFVDVVEREGVRVGLTFEVVGKWTSFVAVEVEESNFELRNSKLLRKGSAPLGFVFPSRLSTRSGVLPDFAFPSRKSRSSQYVRAVVDSLKSLYCSLGKLSGVRLPLGVWEIAVEKTDAWAVETAGEAVWNAVKAWASL
ncbi:hypothetical protein AXG93_4225s1450 [Marchantia polymorpha subsp. ruderalis]|uniref:Uncharacterized protein n=1 Tax=Marchantia polymorpha subsp. ruderalis TaxID=1480154 RepID=A0A176WRU5_MARPO|nr:hypothetical protein AXG93_4225s1450 [Marchantia polymorpha subsp. ruderalis]